MIRIYHTGDLHDHRGFAPRMRALRASEPGFYFDCGDSLRGSQTVYHRRESILRELDDAGCDAQAMGNREFHYVYRCVRARLAQNAHPIVCSNLIDGRGRDLPFARQLMLHAQDVPIRLLGLLVEQYPQGSLWERVFGWRFIDAFEAAEAVAREAAPNELVIALSHLGLRRDRELARAVPRIDLILGGHSHDTLAAPETSAAAPIVHAGPYGRYCSRMELARSGDRWSIERFDLVRLIGA